MLAKMSFDLAAAFQECAKVSLRGLGPQNAGYNVQLGDLARWDK